MIDHIQPLDGCSCRKRAGAWGHYRFHFIRIDEQEAQKMARRDWDESREKHGTMGDEDQARLKERIFAFYRSYVGRPLAYESCPEVMGAIKRRLDKERVEKLPGYEPVV